METPLQQYIKDATRARRLAERVSPNIAQELLDIADEFERLAQKDDHRWSHAGGGTVLESMYLRC